MNWHTLIIFHNVIILYNKQINTALVNDFQKHKKNITGPKLKQYINTGHIFFFELN